MKVVLFCGGLGLRMREASERVPKPMVPIGSRPILWHVMKYFAHFGHTRFVICLGYKGEVIKDYFLGNYGDVLTDAPLPHLIDEAKARDVVASFLSVKPNYSFHLVETDEHDYVKAVTETTHSDLWINGGYFVFKRESFDYINQGEDLVIEPFARLAAERQLFANKYDGFWAPMDTLKDQQTLEQMAEAGNGPWKVWEAGLAATAPTTTAA